MEVGVFSVLLMTEKAFNVKSINNLLDRLRFLNDDCWKIVRYQGRL